MVIDARRWEIADLLLVPEASNAELAEIVGANRPICRFPRFHYSWNGDRDEGGDDRHDDQ